MEEVSDSLHHGQDGCIGVWFWNICEEEGWVGGPHEGALPVKESSVLVNITDDGRELDLRLSDEYRAEV